MVRKHLLLPDLVLFVRDQHLLSSRSSGLPWRQFLFSGMLLLFFLFWWKVFHLFWGVLNGLFILNNNSLTVSFLLPLLFVDDGHAAALRDILDVALIIVRLGRPAVVLSRELDATLHLRTAPLRINLNLLFVNVSNMIFVFRCVFNFMLRCNAARSFNGSLQWQLFKRLRGERLLSGVLAIGYGTEREFAILLLLDFARAILRLVRFLMLPPSNFF